jgi:endonuclease/exonuclease/phosphatase family metal-dependent hydrolase
MSACKEKDLPVEVSIFHYNIKELDSEKIKNKHQQLQYVKEVLKDYQFDILSLNEIQYDMPGVPNSTFKSKGQNLQKLANFFELSELKNDAFYPANTGMNAGTKPDGTYWTNPGIPQARDNADMVNFGTLPGQYSTGALFKFEKLNEVVISDLQWKDFNPKATIEKFTDAKGNPLPLDMPLFDKNFTDVTLDIQGKKVHIILFHTVPAYHFGNENSPNYERNADQLRFLEWYLTGSTDIAVNLKNIKHLKKNDYFIATGDWNTEYKNQINPGSAVLRSLFSKVTSWVNPADYTFTNEGSGYPAAPFRLMLDYIAVSKNIEVLAGKIVLPSFERVDLGCNDKIQNKSQDGMVEVKYRDGSKNCRALVKPEYVTFKNASDHYPIFARLLLK